VLAGLGSPATSAGARAQGTRVVDRVCAAESRSEADHALDGRALTDGQSAGRRWRGAREWFSYTLRTYDDSPLTLVCLFAGTGGRRQEVDVIVEGRKVATQAVWSPGTETVEAVLRVPETWTLGKTSVTVKFQARPGESIPGLLEVRTVQEHLE
jgi:hypothetical protein